MFGGVDEPNGEKEDEKPWRFDCDPKPKPEDGGGEKNLGGGGDVAKWYDGDVNSFWSRRKLRMEFTSTCRTPLTDCLDGKASWMFEKDELEL